MLYPMFGLPGPLTDWCCQAVVALLRAQGHAAQVFSVNSVEDLAVHLIEGHGSVVLRSNRPEQGLLNALNRAQVPVVVGAESPVRSAEFRTVHGGLDRIAAVREVLSDLAALHDVPRRHRVLIVSYQDVLDDPTVVLSAIMRHLGHSELDFGSVGSASRKRFDTLIRTMPLLTADAYSEDAKPVAAPERDPVGDALVGLEDARFEDGSGTILIGPEFFVVTATGKAPAAPLDATGRARGLVHGPFVRLPRGDWIARCVHRYSEDLASASFVIDVVSFAGGSLHEHARSSFKIPTSSGLVEITLQFRVEDPSVPLEVRLFAERAIFSGEIVLGPVVFTRTDSARAEAYPPDTA